MNELEALRAEVASLRKERNEEQKAELDAAMLRAKASASNPENGLRVRQEFGSKPTETALDYGAVLWAQMEAGLPGTAAGDDGYDADV